MVSDVQHVPTVYPDYLARADAKTVSIVALGCSHPAMKVQSASIHFFLGEDDDDEDSEDEEVRSVGTLILWMLTTDSGYSYLESVAAPSRD